MRSASAAVTISAPPRPPAPRVCGAELGPAGEHEPPGVHLEGAGIARLSP